MNNEPYKCYNVRVPPAILAAIRERAARARRSINSEIVVRLERSLEAEQEAAS
jgi:hypothetical protein